MSAPTVQPIPKPMTHDRLAFGRYLVTTHRLTDWPGYCDCLSCTRVLQFAGTGALPAGWGRESDHALNATFRLARLIGRRDVLDQWRAAWLDLCDRAGAFWDGLDPEPEAA